ncbi:hypothetical protein JYU34_015594 [Plutella xylostella]|uniref:Sodium channel protein Nach n=1 Tax=Plutella xylostella TaxID=51655 RepID=A0ABQ7Q4E9_PLUXY|nr:hypothetical protein JYU34_015594 [Plutella xylostella]
MSGREQIVGSFNKPSRKMNREKSKKSIRSQLLSYIRKELTYSTTHALPIIVKKDSSTFDRIFWSASILAGGVMMVVLLTPLYTRFKQSPTVMSVELDYFNWRMSFPALTLCPRNKLDQDAYDAMVREYALITDVELRAILMTIAETTLENLDKINLYNKRLIAALKPEDYATIASRLLPPLGNTSVVDARGRRARGAVAMTELGACHVLYSNQARADDPERWRDPAAAADLEDATGSIDLTIHDADFYTTIYNYAEDYNIYVHSPDDVVLGSARAVPHAGGSLALGVRLHSVRLAPALRAAAPDARGCRCVVLGSARAVPHAVGSLALGVRLHSVRLAPALRAAAPAARGCRGGIPFELVGTYVHSSDEVIGCQGLLLEEPISPRYQTYSYSLCMLECRVRTIARLCGCVPHFYKPLKNETICTLTELRCVNHYRLEIATLSSSPVTLRRQQQTSGFHPSAACGCLTACDTDVYLIDQQDLEPSGKTELRVGIVAFPKVRVMRETIFDFYDIIRKFRDIYI